MTEKLNSLTWVSAKLKEMLVLNCKFQCALDVKLSKLEDVVDIFSKLVFHTNLKISGDNHSKKSNFGRWIWNLVESCSKNGKNLKEKQL